MEPTNLYSLPVGGNCFLSIHYFNKDYMFFPKSFVRAFPELRQYGSVILIDPAENIFVMAVKNLHGCLHFEGAFQEICEMHHINRDVMVHYTYNGAGEFNIRMYYDENVEVNYGGQQEVAPNPDGEFAWLNDITKPMAFGKQCLNVPASIVIEQIPHRPASLNIILPDGTMDLWILKWADGRPNSVGIGHGWYEFGKEKRIRARDQLRFYKMHGQDTNRLEVLRR